MLECLQYFWQYDGNIVVHYMVHNMWLHIAMAYVKAGDVCDKSVMSLMWYIHLVIFVIYNKFTMKKLDILEPIAYHD